MAWRQLFALFCVALLVACSQQRQPGPPHAAGSTSVDWRVAYDLDGDGVHDRIVDEFTEGAHCCYLIGAALSSTGTTVMLPFQMDGGYVGGLDLSQPHQFSIRGSENGLPEIVMQIETYNGVPKPLNPEWRQRYGIRTHRVAASFPDGELLVRDFFPELPPCRGKRSP